MSKKDRLEPLADGFVAFHTERGDRWKHRDITEPAEGGPRYLRLFVSDAGEERRYAFGPREPRDATIWDLRHQLEQARSAAQPAPR